MRNEMLDNLHGKTNKNRDVTASKQNIMRNIAPDEWVDYLKTQAENLKEILSRRDWLYDNKKKQLIDQIKDIASLLNASVNSGLTKEMIKHFYKSVALPEAGDARNLDETFYKVMGYQYIVGINELISYMDEMNNNNLGDERS